MPSQLWRLFIAVELNIEVRQAIGRVQAELKRQLPPKAVRWTNPDGIHLTLKFLGDTPAEKAPAVVEGLSAAAAGFEPFQVHVAGFGCFPNPHRPRVLWAGVPEIPRPLAGVQRAVDLHMARLDYARESRAFSPHLTLGRVNDRLAAADSQALSAVLSRTQVGELGIVQVQEVVLFKSDLRPDGAIYTALARAQLASGHAPAP